MNANELLEKLNLNKTKQRLDIANCILKQKEPFCVSTITNELKEYNKSTIYRFITLLEQNNILEKLPLTNAQGAYYDLKKHSHYFVCKKCKKSIPMSFCPVAAIEKAMPKDMDFTITEHNIEIIGYCKACNK